MSEQTFIRLVKLVLAIVTLLGLAYTPPYAPSYVQTLDHGRGAHDHQAQSLHRPRA